MADIRISTQVDFGGVELCEIALLHFRRAVCGFQNRLSVKD